MANDSVDLYEKCNKKVEYGDETLFCDLCEIWLGIKMITRTYRQLLSQQKRGTAECVRNKKKPRKIKATTAEDNSKISNSSQSHPQRSHDTKKS